MQERLKETQEKLRTTTESNRVISQSLRMKQEECDELKIKYDAAQNKLASATVPVEKPNQEKDDLSAQTDNLISTKGHFYVECKPSQGLMLLKAKQQAHKTGKGQEFIEKYHVNAHLK